VVIELCLLASGSQDKRWTSYGKLRCSGKTKGI
jgi:hypothetical protein